MAECYNKIYIAKYDIEVECGKCLNCIENRKKEAVTRAAVEMKDYINKYFVTLTYNDLNAEIDENGFTKLNKKHVKQYIESLQYIQKRHYRDEYKLEKNKLKYIICGEYGERATKRAHYHMIIMTNIYIERYIKMRWKYGNVKMERIKDIRALSYTAGYTAKKIGKKNKDREIQPFLKWSKGLGKRWIEEKKDKITAKNYFVETIAGKNRLPRYFKNKIKYHVMGVTPKYKVCNEVEREYYDRKTIMVNRVDYTNNLWKWAKFVKEIKEASKERIDLYWQYEKMKERYGDNWKIKLFNLMYNEKWDEMDEVERTFSELKRRQNELLKIKAKQKVYSKMGRRNKIA